MNTMIRFNRWLRLAATLFSSSLALLSPMSAASDPGERPVIGVEHEGPIRVVFQITGDAMAEGVHKDLLTLKNLHANYLADGIPPEAIHIAAVLHGTAADHVLTDEAWNTSRDASSGNPNRELLAELSRNGVSIELCDSRRVINEWEKSDIHPDVLLVGNAYQRLIDLQLRGYAYIKL